jgi:hypothetical protein
MHDSEYLYENATAKGILIKALSSLAIGFTMTVGGILDPSIPEWLKLGLIVMGMLAIAYSLSLSLKSYRFYRMEKKLYKKK